jgi:hemerythrin superfamily protein
VLVTVATLKHGLVVGAAALGTVVMLERLATRGILAPTLTTSPGRPHTPGAPRLSQQGPGDVDVIHPDPPIVGFALGTPDVPTQRGLIALCVGTRWRMDAITMLKDDHEAVEQLFRRYARAGNRAFAAKRAIVDRIIEELSVHAAIEEQLFYPAVRAAVPDTQALGFESLEEHHVVKWVLSEIEGMAPDDDRFDAKVTVLVNNVRHHVEVEEGELFPRVRDELGRKALGDLGEAMARARRIAPTHPHPRAPDRPPGNLIVGTIAGVADRIADALNGFAQGTVTAMGDIIATALRREKPRVSPTGTRVARSTATEVRSAASDATEAAIEGTRKAKQAGERAARTARATGSSATAGAERTLRTAKRGATRTARATKAGAKGTVTSARGSARQTASTAKRGATTTGRTARKAARSTTQTARRAARETASAAAGSRA